MALYVLATGSTLWDQKACASLDRLLKEKILRRQVQSLRRDVLVLQKTSPLSCRVLSSVSKPPPPFPPSGRRHLLPYLPVISFFRKAGQPFRRISDNTPWPSRNQAWQG